MDVSAEEQSRSADEETAVAERRTAGVSTEPNGLGRGANGSAPNGAEEVGAAGEEGNSGNKNEHQFQKAISAWRSIDFSNLVPQLDKTASDVIENQKEAVIQRKELAQKTKDFRKLEDEAKLVEYKTLLKSYQGFIDLLTTHQKTTSSAFLQLYSTVSEAPDPYPLLEASVDSLLVSEDVVPKITAENERLKKSVRSLTRDLEQSEAVLQQERSARKQLEGSQESKAKEIEGSWQAVLDERKDNWEAKERALEEKLESQERLFSEIKASFEVSQRLGGGGGSGGDSNAYASASAAELDLVSSELEKTGLRLAEVESRNEQLRLELAQASSNAPARGNIEDDPAFTRLRSENGSLLRKLEATRLDKDEESRKWEKRIRSLERDTQTLQQEREELRAKVAQWRDYPDLKRELEVFKAIEFSIGDDDDAAPVTNDASQSRHDSKMNGTATSGTSSETLEQLLLARNKKLTNEMAVLRVAHQDLQRELEQLQESTSATNADLERARNLNVTLENDLLTLQQEASNQFPSGRSTTSRYPTSSYGRAARKASPTSSIISGFDSSSSYRGSGLDSLVGGSTGEPMGGGSGILPMVQAQRDRFKQKISQLESELSKQYSTVSSLRQEVSSLQKDNLSLYEKTRYVSTYQRNAHHHQHHQGGSSGSAYSGAGGGGDPGSASHVIQMSSGADTSSGLSLDRYRTAYEANISPFASFRARESGRALRRMSVPERAIFSVTRLVLANRSSRNLFAAYCVALHLLVFVMLYWMQGVDVEKHASNLGDATTAAVAAAGLGVGGALRTAAAGGAAAAAAGGMGGVGGGGGGGGGGGAAGGVDSASGAHHGEWHQEGVEGVAAGLDG